MAHPIDHAKSSARRFGGQPEDYQPIHSWFDASKAHTALPHHRALRHHTFGIFEAEQVFGITITNSLGREIPTRWIGEQHCKEDCRRIPTVADWLRHIPIESWMVNGVVEFDLESINGQDHHALWRKAVADQQTTLGLQDWLEQHKAQNTLT